MSNDSNNQKAVLRVFLVWINGRKYLSKEEKRRWFELGMRYQKDLSFLYRIFYKREQRDVQLIDEPNTVTYRGQQEKHTITYGNTVFSLTEQDLIELISGTIDLLEEIYPLGSVVELKGNYPMVITKRFVSPSDETDYFEYAGIPYPAGSVNADHVLYFTQESIQKVLQRGYGDDRDHVFICTMKYTLVVKENRRSVSFSKNREKYRIF